MRPPNPPDNTTSSWRLDGGRNQARTALTTTKNISQFPPAYKPVNLADILPQVSETWSADVIGRVRCAVESYCLAMTAGDTVTMSAAAMTLVDIADFTANTTLGNEYTHTQNTAYSNFGTVQP